MFGGPNSERILVFTPVGRDAEVASNLLIKAGYATFICAQGVDLCAEIEKGAGLAIVSEEAMTIEYESELKQMVQAQPAWSDFPVVLLTSRGDAPDRNSLAHRFQSVFGNVSFLERPFHATTLISVVNTALRSRRRQYQARELLERYELLARELQHRSKNLLTVIKSIAAASLRDDPGRKTFFARLQALAKAQDLIMEGDARGAPMKEVVEQAVAGFGSKIWVEGPHVFLKASVAQGFALILHELATNAAKYGSLSAETGRITVRWWEKNDSLVFIWQERGGPPAVPPKHKGFGSVLLEHAVANGGTPPRYDFTPEGFTYELTAVHVSPPSGDTGSS
jgi:two-component sensor histidine kinase